MQAVPVSQSIVCEHNRWDPKYYCLLAEHQPLVAELMTKFAYEELVTLARKLPFDEKAADAVVPRAHTIRFDEFIEWAEGKQGASNRAKRQWLAAYVAAAAQGATARRLEEFLALQRAQIAHLEAVKALQDMAKGKQATHLLAAIKGH